MEENVDGASGASEELWRKRLFEFALEHRRVCTLREWRMMRQAFELERFFESTRDVPVSMAADGETLNTVLAALSARTWTANFLSPDDSCHLNVTFRPQSKGEPTIYLRLTNGDGDPLPGGRIVFPGIGDGVVTDGRGRATVPYRAYLDALRSVMSFSVVTQAGTTYPMEID